MSLPITPAQLHSILSLGIAVRLGVRDRGFTPILDNVHVHSNGDNSGGLLIAEATDRYRVARVEMHGERPTDGEAFDYVIPIELLMQASKLCKPSDANYLVVEISQDDDTITITLPTGASVNAPRVTGNFPPIGRLIPSVDDRVDIFEGTLLSPALLSDIGKLRIPGGRGVTGDTMLGMYGTKSAHDTKRGPVLFESKPTKEGDVEYILQYMQQPALNLR
jgi:hypothetical protein